MKVIVFESKPRESSVLDVMLVEKALSDPDRAEALGLCYASFDELSTRADVVTLHAISESPLATRPVPARTSSFPCFL